MNRTNDVLSRKPGNLKLWQSFVYEESTVYFPGNLFRIPPTSEFQICELPEEVNFQKREKTSDAKRAGNTPKSATNCNTMQQKG